ncbi:methylated-DNA--[protein]-cysteine S-methyltransferase [Neobacillus sp. SM06]|uniref:methylated-DNA--[protein]-cysteine S-methyltransferase n=1 Tax=Neobacillus sp. SM06 TaxID=3422492 RepID=UPI003D266E42
MGTSYAAYESPLGAIRVVANEMGITRVEIFEDDWEQFLAENPSVQEDGNKICSEAIVQLEEYFKGQRKSFDLPLVIDGTDFRKRVWQALQTIPYGEIRSYAEIAEMIGSPKAIRAVGQANKANQWPIIIPCHRVIGKSGDLVGYAGGRTSFKEKLLELEGYQFS